MSYMYSGKTCSASRRSDGTRCRRPVSRGDLCAMHDYARPPEIELPVEELVRDYEQGQSLAEIARRIGVSYVTVRRRLTKAGVRLRSPKENARYNYQQAADVKALWESGLSVNEVADRLSVKPYTVYRRLREVGWDAEAKRLKAMYIEEELPISVIAARLRHSPSTVSEKLKALGIELRHQAGKVRQPVASKPTVRAIQTATTMRRLTGRSPRTLTPKQRDMLDIVRASPAPIATGRILNVARELPREWNSLSVGNIGACLKRLEPYELVKWVWGTHDGVLWRGSRVRLWLPASAEIAEPQSEADAQRLREIQVLVEQQLYDDRAGHRVRRTGVLSLDSSLSESGGSLAELLGCEDEKLAELGAAA